MAVPDGPAPIFLMLFERFRPVIEAFFLDWIAGQIMGKKLQRHIAVKLRVVGFVNDTHAAFVELLED